MPSVLNAAARIREQAADYLDASKVPNTPPTNFPPIPPARSAATNGRKGQLP